MKIFKSLAIGMKRLAPESADFNIFVLLLLIPSADAHNLLMCSLACHGDPFIHVIQERGFQASTCTAAHSFSFLTKLLMGDCD